MSYNRSTATIVFNGETRSIVYQSPDGSYFLCRHADGAIERLSEVEVRAFLNSAIARSEVEEVVDRVMAVCGFRGKLPARVRQQIIDNTHRTAAHRASCATGSAPTTKKLLEDAS
jgi:hypothetical protein